MSDNITPPEIIMLSNESPKNIGRLLDMFLSRNDFDPKKSILRGQHEQDLLTKERNEVVEKVLKDAELARQEAERIAKRANDIADTIRRIRG